MWAMPSGSDLISIKLFNNGKWMGTDFTVDLSPYLTKEDAQETYQPIGDYATEEWVNGLNLQPKNDETLNTENKTIPGSINELLDLINNNEFILFNVNNVNYKELKTALKGGKLIYIKDDDDYYIVTNYSKDISDTIALFCAYGDCKSNGNGSLSLVSFKISSTETTLTKEKKTYHIEEGTDFFMSNSLIVSDVLPDFIKLKIRSILTLGNGLGWGTDNSIEVTLDTNVFFVAESVPASPNDNQKKKICLVPADTTEEGNFYTEYVWVVDDEHPDGYWEEFGTYKSEVDLTPYLKIEDAKSTYATKTELSSHTDNTENPHSVTKAQVGLGNVDNTSDANKPVSTAQQAAINAVDNKTTVVTQVPTLAADYTVPANATSREYVYNISVGATVYNITGAEGIKWADGVAPIATANSTIVVSVMNNLAVWGTF